MFTETSAVLIFLGSGASAFSDASSAWRFFESGADMKCCRVAGNATLNCSAMRQKSALPHLPAAARIASAALLLGEVSANYSDKNSELFGETAEVCTSSPPCCSKNDSAAHLLGEVHKPALDAVCSWVFHSPHDQACYIGSVHICVGGLCCWLSLSTGNGSPSNETNASLPLVPATISL